MDVDGHSASQSTHPVSPNGSVSSKTKPRKLQQKLRMMPARLYRGNTPICWMLAILQGLSVCEWSRHFYQRETPITELKDIFSLIQEIRWGSKSIPKKENKRIAQRIIWFNNSHKKRDALTTDQWWSIDRQQDASEFLQYFFNLFSDQRRKNDEDFGSLKNFLQYKIQTIQSRSIACPCGNHSLPTDIKNPNVDAVNFMKIPIPNIDRKITVQNLLDEYFKAETLSNANKYVCEK